MNFGHYSVNSCSKYTVTALGFLIGVNFMQLHSLEKVVNAYVM